ncbi:hypothetical protein [Rhizobium leguminosarum]|nr:hypothetical protein [Rhizobium leguminosarum]
MRMRTIEHFDLCTHATSIDESVDFWLVSEPVIMAEKYKQHLIR